MSSSHLAYLLRIWSVGEGETPQLRASLEESLTRQTTSFTNLEDLFQFLREDTRRLTRQTPPGDVRGKPLP
jgi:hypothetical protein